MSLCDGYIFKILDFKVYIFMSKNVKKLVILFDQYRYYFKKNIEYCIKPPSLNYSLK